MAKTETFSLSKGRQIPSGLSGRNVKFSWDESSKLVGDKDSEEWTYKRVRTEKIKSTD